MFSSPLPLAVVGVQYLVYVARSVHSSESEAMIRTVLEKHETSQRRHVSPTAQQDQEGTDEYDSACVCVCVGGIQLRHYVHVNG